MARKEIFILCILVIMTARILCSLDALCKGKEKEKDKDKVNDEESIEEIEEFEEEARNLRGIPTELDKSKTEEVKTLVLVLDSIGDKKEKTAVEYKENTIEGEVNEVEMEGPHEVTVLVESECGSSSRKAMIGYAMKTDQTVTDIIIRTICNHEKCLSFENIKASKMKRKVTSNLVRKYYYIECLKIEEEEEEKRMAFRNMQDTGEYSDENIVDEMSSRALRELIIEGARLNREIRRKQERHDELLGLLLRDLGDFRAWATPKLINDREDLEEVKRVRLGLGPNIYSDTDDSSISDTITSGNQLNLEKETRDEGHIKDERYTSLGNKPSQHSEKSDADTTNTSYSGEYILSSITEEENSLHKNTKPVVIDENALNQGKYPCENNCVVETETSILDQSEDTEKEIFSPFNGDVCESCLLYYSICKQGDYSDLNNIKNIITQESINPMLSLFISMQEDMDYHEMQEMLKKAYKEHKEEWEEADKRIYSIATNQYKTYTILPITSEIVVKYLMNALHLTRELIYVKKEVLERYPDRSMLERKAVEAVYRYPKFSKVKYSKAFGIQDHFAQENTPYGLASSISTSFLYHSWLPGSKSSNLVLLDTEENNALFNDKDMHIIHEHTHTYNAECIIRSMHLMLEIYYLFFAFIERQGLLEDIDKKYNDLMKRTKYFNIGSIIMWEKWMEDNGIECIPDLRILPHFKKISRAMAFKRLAISIENEDLFSFHIPKYSKKNLKDILKETNTTASDFIQFMTRMCTYLSIINQPERLEKEMDNDKIWDFLLEPYRIDEPVEAIIEILRKISINNKFPFIQKTEEEMLNLMSIPKEISSFQVKMLWFVCSQYANRFKKINTALIKIKSILEKYETLVFNLDDAKKGIKMFTLRKKQKQKEAAHRPFQQLYKMIDFVLHYFSNAQKELMFETATKKQEKNMAPCKEMERYILDVHQINTCYPDEIGVADTKKPGKEKDSVLTPKLLYEWIPINISSTGLFTIAGIVNGNKIDYKTKQEEDICNEEDKYKYSTASDKTVNEVVKSYSTGEVNALGNAEIPLQKSKTAMDFFLKKLRDNEKKKRNSYSLDAKEKLSITKIKSYFMDLDPDPDMFFVICKSEARGLFHLMDIQIVSPIIKYVKLVVHQKPYKECMYELILQNNIYSEMIRQNIKIYELYADLISRTNEDNRQERASTEENEEKMACLVEGWTFFLSGIFGETSCAWFKSLETITENTLNLLIQLCECIIMQDKVLETGDLLKYVEEIEFRLSYTFMLFKSLQELSRNIETSIGDSNSNSSNKSTSALAEIRNANSNSEEHPFSTFITLKKIITDCNKILDQITLNEREVIVRNYNQGFHNIVLTLKESTTPFESAKDDKEEQHPHDFCTRKCIRKVMDNKAKKAYLFISKTFTQKYSRMRSNEFYLAFMRDFTNEMKRQPEKKEGKKNERLIN